MPFFSVSFYSYTPHLNHYLPSRNTQDYLNPLKVIISKLAELEEMENAVNAFYCTTETTLPNATRYGPYPESASPSPILLLASQDMWLFLRVLAG
jgi:hypothetical protein